MFGTMRVVRWYDLAIFSEDGEYLSGMGWRTHVCLDSPSVASGGIPAGVEWRLREAHMDVKVLFQNRCRLFSKAAK